VLLDFLYLLGLGVAVPFVVWKMATRSRVRAGLFERLGLRVGRRPGGRPCIWVHGVSVGEVLAAKPLVREIERELPAYEVAISTTTNMGLEVARKHFPGKHVFYYPLDFSWSVRRALEAVRPDLIVLVELEIWPNFLGEAYQAGIPVVLVNGRISEKSFRGYRLVKKLLFRPLAKIRRFCVQTDEYAARFLALGVPREQILVTGTLKYDGLPAPEDAERFGAEYRERLGLGAAPVLVCGSTHPPEERELLAVYRRLRAEIPSLRLVLVPRHLERLEDVLREVRDAGERCVRKREIDAGTAAPAPEAGPAPVIVVDTMGELARVYAAATVVFVGGSLVRRGGQNMLEPAGLGRATIFGPHVENFRESAEMLLRAGGAVQVGDAADLERTLRELLAQPARRADMGARARAAIEAHHGAAARSVAVVKEVLAERGSPRPRRGAGRRGAGGGAPPAARPAAESQACEPADSPAEPIAIAARTG
jgi:3-deoxy-D-manno-octulosonic-acid transferase